MTDLISDKDFDRMLEKLVTDQEDDATTMIAANAREDLERQDFLSSFRGALHAVIKPIYEQAAANPALSRTGRCEVDIKPKEYEAHFFFKRNNGGRYDLSYKTDYEQRRVTVTSSGPQGSEVTAKLMEAELTKDQVRTTLAKFLKSAVSR